MNTSKHETLLDKLDSSRERLLIAIEPLPDAALRTKGAVGDWSVADLLAILTAWEAELATGLMRLDQGKKPNRLLRALANPQAYNAQRYAETQKRDLDSIFDDFQRVRIQVEEWLDAFSERDLSHRKRYAGLKGRALSEIIAAATFEHESRYLEALEAFTRRWLASQPDKAPEFIPLTAVDAPPSDPVREEFNHDNQQSS